MLSQIRRAWCEDWRCVDRYRPGDRADEDTATGGDRREEYRRRREHRSAGETRFNDALEIKLVRKFRMRDVSLVEHVVAGGNLYNNCITH